MLLMISETFCKSFLSGDIFPNVSNPDGLYLKIFTLSAPFSFAKRMVLERVLRLSLRTTVFIPNDNPVF